MSVIIRDHNGAVILYCKGADTVIYERLDYNCQSNNEIGATTKQDLEDFGASGLRTLCLAYTEGDPSFYEE